MQLIDIVHSYLIKVHLKLNK